jgi:signal transduction histidine kinase
VGEGPRLFGGRFESVRLLKRGRSTDSVLAWDRRGALQVVLKVAPAELFPAQAQKRFERAAQLLGSSTSGFLAPIIHVGREEGLFFAARPFAPGSPLTHRTPLPLRPALAVGRCVFSALQEAHQRGVLHRHLTPASVIVEDGARHATLIDFGEWSDSRAAEESPALALYASPEQAGLLEREVDESADLYSAGVVLYECLSGRNPFRAASLGEILHRHLTIEAPTLRSQGIEAPRALDELLQRLLRKEPRERYRTAAAALHDLGELEASLGGGERRPLVIGARERRRTLVSPSFVGRAKELLALEEHLQRAFDGGQDGGLVLVEAESGGGKTRLLEELAERALQRGARVLRGQAIDQGAPLPYQFLAGVVRGVVEQLRSAPLLAARAAELLAAERDVLCEMFPELAPFLGGAAAPAASDELRQARAGRAVHAFLSALGAAAAPAVVLLDDLQWSGEQGPQLLNELLRNPVPYLLVIGAFRPDEAGEGLRRLAAQERLVLPPLAAAEIAGMAESMAGPLPPEALAAVERLGKGNPFLGAAVLHGLVETSALVSGEDGWRIEPAAMQDLQSSRQAGAVLARRLERLPEETLHLLTAGALLGKTFDLQLAATLAGQDLPAALRSIEEGRRRHLVWAASDGGSCSLVHDRVREQLLARLGETERRGLHLGAARMYAASAGDRSFDLAHHFAAAREPAQALPHALAAAAGARARYAFGTAVRYYRIAWESAGAADAGTRLQIAEVLAHLLGIRGHYDEAVELMEAALGLAATGAERIRVLRLLGEIHFRRGAQADAIRVLEEALHVEGEWVPKGRAAFAAGLCWEAARLAAHGLLPARWRKRAPAAGTGRGLTFSYIFERGTIATLWAQLRELNMAERQASGANLAQACAEHAYVMALVPWSARSIAYARRALALACASGDAHLEARMRHCLAVVLCWAGRYAESIELERAAAPALERLGDATWASFALGRMSIALRHEGALREAAAIGKGFDHARLDTQSVSFTLEAWSLATGGRIPAQAIAAARARCRVPQELVNLARAEGVRLLADGNPALAALEFAEAERIVRAVGLRGPYAGNSAAWLATALRMELSQQGPLAGARRAQLSRDAMSASRRSLRVARAFPETLSHALRERGFLEALRGNLARSRAAFDRSVAVAQARGMRAERAQARWLRGQVGAAAGWPDAADDVREGLAELRALGGEPLDARPRLSASQQGVTFSLVDRYEQVLRAGHAIATAQSAAAVQVAAVDAVSRLLRPESCEILPHEKPLASRAIAARAPVIEEPAESARSALCVPVFAHGVAVCCILASSSRLPEQFGEDDERLAAFIANLAGAALENLEHQAARDRAEGEVRRLTASSIHGQEEERRRLAHALHDGAGQALAAVLIQLAVLEKAMPARHLGEKVSEVRALTKAILGDLRGLTQDLRPALLDRLGLAAALHELARSMTSDELRVDCLVEPPSLRLPGEVSITLFRIAQAALANLAQHAGARCAQVTLAGDGGSVRLQIEDDGKGFDPAAPGRGAGIGIIGMRERAAWLGGTFRIESAPGRGTRVVVELPPPAARA